jgi:hypothetical protein
MESATGRWQMVRRGSGLADARRELLWRCELHGSAKVIDAFLSNYHADAGSLGSVAEASGCRVIVMVGFRDPEEFRRISLWWGWAVDKVRGELNGSGGGREMPEDGNVLYVE